MTKHEQYLKIIKKQKDAGPGRAIQVPEWFFSYDAGFKFGIGQWEECFDKMEDDIEDCNYCSKCGSKIND